jgi:hypothetical protein
MLMIFAVFMAAFVQATSGEAAPADCAVPTPPAVIRPIKPTRPTAPSCVDEARGRHNCRSAIINAYNAEMDAAGRAFTDYVDKLNNYTADLNDYATAATRYAACERRRAGPEGLIAF